MGEVSDIRRKILQNILNETISTKFRIVPQERFEEAQEEAFQQLEYEECTEDQCIMLIQEMLQVEHLFQLEVIAEGQMVQLRIIMATLYEKNNKTEIHFEIWRRGVKKDPSNWLYNAAHSSSKKFICFSIACILYIWNCIKLSLPVCILIIYNLVIGGEDRTHHLFYLNYYSCRNSLKLINL